MARRNRKPQPRRSPDNPAASIATGTNGAATLTGEMRATTVAEPPIIAPAEASPGMLASLEQRLGARRLDIALSLGFVVLALVLYFWRIEAPWNGNRGYIYDEVYHAYTAAQYVNGNTDAWVWWTQSPVEGTAYEWTHPPLGKEIIAIGIWLFGDDRFGWRFMSAIGGAIGVGMIYWLGLLLTRRRIGAILASILILVDGLYFVESRSSLLDIFGAVFMVGAFIAFSLYLAAPATKVRWPLLGMGLGLGLAIATKWNAGYAAAIIGLVVMVRTAYLLYQWLTKRDEVREAGRVGFLQHLVWVPIGMAILPVAVYLFTYLPFFTAGFTFDQFKELQRQMYVYHTNLKATHQFQSAWWQWPLAQRPVWYGVDYRMGEGIVGNTYANGNPLLYWSFFAAVPYALVLWWQREQYRPMLVLAIGFFGQWLPWALVPRIAYAYHFLPAAIFGVLAVAVTLDDLWQLGERQIAERRRPIWQYAAIGYTVVIVAAFIFFYPIYTNWPLTKPEIDARMWLDSWR